MKAGGKRFGGALRWQPERHVRVSFLTICGTLWASHFSNASRCSAVQKATLRDHAIRGTNPVFSRGGCRKYWSKCNRPKFPANQGIIFFHHILRLPPRKATPR